MRHIVFASPKSISHFLFFTFHFSSPTFHFYSAFHFSLFTFLFFTFLFFTTCVFACAVFLTFLFFAFFIFHFSFFTFHFSSPTFHFYSAFHFSLSTFHFPFFTFRCEKPGSLSRSPAISFRMARALVNRQICFVTRDSAKTVHLPGETVGSRRCFCQVLPYSVRTNGLMQVLDVAIAETRDDG